MWKSQTVKFSEIPCQIIVLKSLFLFYFKNMTYSFQDNFRGLKSLKSLWVNGLWKVFRTTLV